MKVRIKKFQPDDSDTVLVVSEALEEDSKENVFEVPDEVYQNYQNALTNYNWAAQVLNRAEIPLYTIMEKGRRS